VAGLTRRRLLVGGALLAAAGVGGAEAVERFGPATEGAHGDRSVSGRLESRYMHASMGWTIAWPIDGRRPRAVVYGLHGKGSDHTMAFDGVGVPEAAAAIGMPVVVAAVDGGADSYWHRRADGTDALAMLLREFVPLVRGRVGHLPQALMGWSMGGYGALLAAEQAPGRFAAVAPASPAIWLAPGLTAPGAFDSPADFYAHDVFTGIDRLSPLGVAVACGTGDPFYPATEHLVSLMTFPHAVFYGPGQHDDAYWRTAAPQQLRAIAPALGLKLPNVD
jgi:S-formylglutathione hydrolase FrmB